jgi:CheY-like chemotaxis protein
MAPRKILLAEDDTDDQKLFYEFLQHRTDIQLLPVAENGEEILSALETTTNDDRLPDLIILDQNMPKRNGLQTLRALKETDRYAHIPVMVYSTFTDEQLINIASKMGASAVVPKPLSKDGYNEMIDVFLRIAPGK